MSNITGKKFGEPFKMRVVSGMLVNGEIRISWATGEKASSQLDWGFDSSVPFTTEEFNLEPQDMTRYHTLNFPDVFMDREHFFRVRSRTAADKVGVSPVYSVIVPDALRFAIGDNDLVAEFELTIIEVPFSSFSADNLKTSLPQINSEPIAIGNGHNLSHSSNLDPIEESHIDEQNDPEGLHTNINFSIDD